MQMINMFKDFSVSHDLSQLWIVYPCLLWTTSGSHEIEIINCKSKFKYSTLGEQVIFTSPCCEQAPLMQVVSNTCVPQIIPCFKTTP